MNEKEVRQSDSGSRAYTYRTPVSILDECNRISYEVTMDDFNTSYVNPYRVGKLNRSVREYLRYKQKNT